MKLIRYIAILFLMLDSCIEPFNLNVATRETLVVDGMISDQPGPHTVKIFKTLSLDDELNVIDWVRGASVSIFDEQGNEMVFKEMAPGNYQSDSLLQGVIGKTYTLRFTTTDDAVYESKPEKLLPVGDIDTLYREFEQKESPFTIEHGNSLNGFNVFLNAQVLPEQEGLVRWRWTGTFGIKTFPELKTKASDTKITTMIPDPPACSGYRVQRGTTLLEYSGPCSCCYCWVTQYNDAVSLSDQRFISNNKITGLKMAFIQANRRYLYEKYYLEVEQMSVSQGVYDFWKRVAAQQTTGSNLFQTPPPPTGGNIQLISGSVPALGIFSASAIKKRSMVFTKDDVPYIVLPIDTIALSCKQAYRYSSTKKPFFW